MSASNKAIKAPKPSKTTSSLVAGSKAKANNAPAPCFVKSISFLAWTTSAIVLNAPSLRSEGLKSAWAAKPVKHNVQTFCVASEPVFISLDMIFTSPRLKISLRQLCDWPMLHNAAAQALVVSARVDAKNMTLMSATTPCLAKTGLAWGKHAKTKMASAQNCCVAGPGSPVFVLCVTRTATHLKTALTVVSA